MRCKNCKHLLEGNYCHHCGQSAKVRRINFKYVINEISRSVFQVNHGILYTIKELFTRPGYTIRAFLEGKRKPYYKPLAFILLLSAIYALITFLFGESTYLGEVFAGMASAMNDDGKEPSLTVSFFNWLSNNFAYSTLLLLPVFSLATYLSFIKERYNYFEHLVLNSYISGQQIIVYLVFSLPLFLFKIEGYYVQIIPVIIATVYLFWVIVRFFKGFSIFKKLILSILAYLLYFILVVFLMFIMGVIEGIIQ